MRKILSQAIASLFFISLLISCNNKRKQIHVEEDYVFKGTMQHNILFAEGLNQFGEKQKLDLDLYLPQDAQNSKKYPLMVFIHGGGFRAGEKKEDKSFCEILADKGFVIASINYRTGWEKEQDPCKADTNKIKVAVYRAMQDTHEAFRFLVANAAKYQVDTNWIFISGSSAGGILSLATVYYPQDSANIFFGHIADTLGPLKNTEATLPNYTIKGIAALWGGLNSPFLITKNNAVPTIFFHGERDNVVPYNVNHFYSCSDLFSCYGTKPLYDRMVSLGEPVDAYIDPEGGHGVYTAKFRAQTTSDFFHGIIKGQIPTGFHVEKMNSLAAK